MHNIMYFSRSSTYQTTGSGDTIDFTPTASLTFPANTQAISFTAEFDGGVLRSNTTSGKTVDVNLVVACNGNSITLTSTSIYVASTNNSSTSVTINDVVPSSVQKTICQYGITDIWLEQASDSRFRGYPGSGTLTIAYESSVSLGAPGTPTIDTDGNGNYTVSWTAASASGGSGNVTYTVYYGPEGSTASAGTSLSTKIAIPASYYNTAISFFIEASYSGETSTSGTKSYTATRAALSAPTNVTLNATTSYGSNVTLSWASPGDASNNHITGFKIERREYNGSSWGNWGDLTTTTATSLSVAVPGTPNYQYQFRVTALGQASNSSATVSSNTVTRIYGTMPAPTNVSLSATTSYGSPVTLSWKSGGDGSGNPLLSFTVDRRESDGSTYGNWETLQTGIAKVAASQTQSINVAVPSTPGHIYQFRVKAIGTYSNSSETVSSNTVTTIYGTMPAPSNVVLSATTSFGEQVTLSWVSGGNGSNNILTAFEIERRESDGSSYGEWNILQTDISKNTTSINVNVPTISGHIYQFRVKAIGTYSNSSTTTSSNTITRLIQSKCSVPSTFYATDARSNNKYFYLIWDGALGGENNNITGYEIQTCISTNNGNTWGSWTSVGVFEPSVSNLHLLMPTVRWTCYRYRIQVRGSGGSTYYSDWKELSEPVKRPALAIQEILFANGTVHVKMNGQWTTDTTHLYTTQWDTI